MIKNRIFSFIAVGSCVSFALAATACGSSSGTDSSGGHGTSETTNIDQAARNLLPPSIKSAGTLIDGSEIDYAPYSFYDLNDHPSGLAVDMITAIANELGLRIVVKNIGVASVIPSIQSGRIDVADNGYFITAARRAQVSFVHDENSTNSLLVAKGNPANITANDICGKTIGVEAGTDELGLVQAAASQCSTSGKSAPVVSTYSTLTSQTLAIESGRVNAGPMGTAGATYIAKEQPTKFEVASGLFGGNTPIGIMIKKGNSQLGAALVAALQALAKDGTYQKILAKWGVTDSAASPAFEA